MTNITRKVRTTVVKLDAEALELLHSKGYSTSDPVSAAAYLTYLKRLDKQRKRTTNGTSKKTHTTYKLKSTTKAA